jgi:hypothetical protein
MKVIEKPLQATTDLPSADPLTAEALIKEARQRQRRRWVLVMVTMVLIASATAWTLSSKHGAGRANAPKAPTQITNLTQFLTRARNGETEALTATYRYLSGPNRGEVFTFVQRPHGGAGSMAPFKAGEFRYSQRYRATSFRFVQRGGLDYECLKAGKAGWSCEGPSYESIGGVIAALFFDMPAGVEFWVAPPKATDATISPDRVNGFSVTCAKYPWGPSTARWCITDDGVTAYVAASNYAATALVALSHSVPAHAFSLPAEPTKWHGDLEFVPGLP